jgi:hypothetical protein
MKTAIAFIVIALLMFTCTYGGTKKVPGGIEFTYYDPYAFSVSLAGNFNNWSTMDNPLTKDEDGTWRVVVDLPAGTYEYKFVVNGGEWVADPDNPKVVGDYGNSEITVDEEGNPVIKGVVEVTSNTPLHSRVIATGWYRATFSTRRNALGDARWRGSRPSHEMYISVNPSIGDQVKGSATILMDSGIGDIREIRANLYAGWLSYVAERFAISGFHNVEALSFDDPMRIVGNIDLPGSYKKDRIDHGRGTQGLVGDFTFGGVKAKAFFTNAYDYDIYNSETRFEWDPEAEKFDTLSRYDNIDTDLAGVRAKASFLGARWAGTFVSERNGFWVGFEDQEEPQVIKDYRERTGDYDSFWFEMGTSEMFAGADVAYDVVDWLELFGEYGHQSYDAKWDAANRVRVQGDQLVDGKIDVPVGDRRGHRYKFGMNAAKEPYSLMLSYERRDHDAMEADMVYFSHHGLPFEDTDSPILNLYGPSLLSQSTYRQVYRNVQNIENFVIFEHEPLPSLESDIAEFDFSTYRWGLNLDLEMDIADTKWSYRDTVLDDAGVTYFRIMPRVSGNLFSERVKYTLLYEGSRDNLHNRMQGGPFGVDEFVMRGDIDLLRHWKLYCNLRWAGYDYSESEDDGLRTDKSESFFNPHFAFVWTPVRSVELRFMWGVNPIYYRDTPLEGREIGRERWLSSHMWLKPDDSLVDAERMLDNLEMISIMGVISF